MTPWNATDEELKEGIPSFLKQLKQVDPTIGDASVLALAVVRGNSTRGHTRLIETAQGGGSPEHQGNCTSTDRSTGVVLVVMVVAAVVVVV